MSYIEPTINNGVNNSSASMTYGSSTAVLSVTCESGYYLDGTPTAVMSFDDDPFADDVDIDMSLSSDLKGATGTIYMADLEMQTTITIKGNAKKKETPTPTITNTVENTTLEYNYDSDASAYKVYLTTSNGYVFDGTPYINWKNLETEEQGTTNFVLQDNNTLGYCELTTPEATDMTMIGSTVPYKKETTVTNNVSGTELKNLVISGMSVSGVLVGSNEQNVFVNVKATWDEGEASLKPTEPYSNRLSFGMVVPQGSEVVITGAFRGVCKASNNMTGCSVIGLESFYIEGDTVMVTAKANDGTSFSDTDKPKIVWYDSLSVPTETEMVLSDDKKTATGTYTLSSVQSDITYTSLELTGSTSPDVVITGYGSINVYKVDTDALDAFAEARFKYKETTETGLTPDGDLGEYVNRLHKVYFDVGSTTATTIKCGNNDTGIACESINEPVKHIEFGFVSIPRYGSGTAYLNNKLSVFLPFVGFVDIDAAYSGDFLNLSYDIDVVTGEGVYNLTVGGVTIRQGVCDCSNEVIYRTSQTETLNTVGSDKFKSTYLLGLKPYLSVQYYNDLEAETYDTRQKMNISDVIGYAKFTDVSLGDIQCTATEYNEIKTLLEAGVYI